MPPKLAIPIIENASLEEDFLQDLWARLLSSAQNSGSIRSAFIDIIKQLEVIDVKILNTMFDDYVSKVGRENVHNGTPRRISFSKTSIIDELKIPEHVYEDSIDNLMRERCVCSEVKEASGISFIGGESATTDKG